MDLDRQRKKPCTVAAKVQRHHNLAPASRMTALNVLLTVQQLHNCISDLVPSQQVIVHFVMLEMPSV